MPLPSPSASQPIEHIVAWTSSTMKVVNDSGFPIIGRRSLAGCWLYVASRLLPRQQTQQRAVAGQRQGTTNRERDHAHMGTFPYGHFWERIDYGKSVEQQLVSPGRAHGCAVVVFA